MGGGRERAKERKRVSETRLGPRRSSACETKLEEGKVLV